MDDTACGYRDSILGLLELIASSEEQRTFAAKVPYDDYASEFYCLWFDDFFHPDSDLAQRAFRPNELDILRSFSVIWEREDTVLGQNDRSIEELLANANWCSVIEAATQAKARLKSRAT
jgi:hypothetical protein